MNTTNVRPTPETDAACHEIYAQGVAHIPLVGFMEKLERERDEAREPLGFFDATNSFIDSGLLHYANHSAKDLTQVFMHGPFAGWSERQVIELIRRMDENRKIYRLAMEPSRDTNTEGGPK